MTASEPRAAGSGSTSYSSIAASAKPTLSSVQYASDSTLTGWTTSLSAGDAIKLTIDSVSTAKQLTLSFKGTR